MMMIILLQKSSQSMDDWNNNRDSLHQVHHQVDRIPCMGVWRYMKRYWE